MVRYVLSFQKITIQIFKYNLGINIWHFSRVYVIIVKTTRNWKSIYSSRKIATLALDLRIWRLVWPTYVICALLVPDIICNACIKGIFEVDSISRDMQYFVTRNILYLPYSTQYCQYIFTMIVFQNTKCVFSRKWGTKWKFDTNILREKFIFFHFVPSFSY